MKFVTLKEAEKLALKRMGKKKFIWLESGAEDGFTFKKNFYDLQKIKIFPNHLKSVGTPDLKRDFFGYRIKSPIILAPMGHQTQFHKDGEIETARGVEKENTVAFFRTQGRISLDDIRKKNKNSILGWTIFPFGNLKWIISQIKNAEKNKCVAIAICIDANVRSWRYSDREARYDARNFGRRTNPISPYSDIGKNYDWNLVSFIKKNSNLPIIVKGVLTQHDAIKCMSRNIDGIWISNHGGRMFNSGISSVDALKEINKLKNIKRKTIIVDGGVRKGSDIIKYLCLGSDFVAVGRPVIHGLSCEKKEGVSKIFRILNEELETCMVNGGFKTKSDFSERRIKY